MIAALGTLLALASAGAATSDGQPVPADGKATVEHLHVVIDRLGDRLEIKEMWRLTGGAASAGEGLRIQLPKGAVAAAPTGPKGMPPLLVLEGNSFRLTRPIPEGGIDVALRFELPIVGGAAVLKQPLPAKVASAEIVATWTAGETRLLVDRVGEGRRSQLANGLIALVAQAKGLDRQLVVRLEQLEDPDSGLLPRATLIVCLLLLGSGFGLWLRRR